LTLLVVLTTLTLPCERDLQTTATPTPTGMQSAKLGQVTKYLRVIGQHELSTLCDKLTDKLIAAGEVINSAVVVMVFQGVHIAIKRINRSFTPSKPLLLECKKVGRCFIATATNYILVPVILRCFSFIVPNEAVKTTETDMRCTPKEFSSDFLFRRRNVHL